jgi:hypothetical protein
VDTREKRSAIAWDNDCATAIRSHSRALAATLNREQLEHYQAVMELLSSETVGAAQARHLARVESQLTRARQLFPDDFKRAEANAEALLAVETKQ